MGYRKIWLLSYVAGNPTMFTKVHTEGPVPRWEAVEAAERMDKHGWRAWVAHQKTGKRIFESTAEKAMQQ